MYLREITVDEYEFFSNNHIYSNFHQTLNYAKLKGEEGYEYELLGLFNEEILCAATLLLVNKVGSYLYGYCPEGYLINYNNEEIFKTFTHELKKYCEKEDIIFVKLNPSIVISQINNKTKNKEFIENGNIINNFKKYGYTHLKDNLYFESVLPRTNVIKSLKDINDYSFKKNVRNKIKKANRCGLVFEKTDGSKIDVIENLVKRKVDKDKYHYNDYYNIFSSDDSIDYFLVSINYKNFLLNTEKLYEKELINNKYLSQKIMNNPSERLINKKLASDKNILIYKNDISYASKHLEDTTKYLAGALCIKHNNKVTILINGYDKKYKNLNANYFLYYNIMMYYKDSFDYIDLNGITLDFNKDNKYYGLNEFKLSFNPNIYEYIGEYDLVINERVYNKLLNNGTLAKVFNKDI